MEFTGRKLGSFSESKMKLNNWASGEVGTRPQRCQEYRFLLPVGLTPRPRMSLPLLLSTNPPSILPFGGWETITERLHSFLGLSLCKRPARFTQVLIGLAWFKCLPLIQSSGTRGWSLWIWPPGALPNRQLRGRAQHSGSRGTGAGQRV